MNPETTLRPWLLAVGKRYGIRKAFEYIWPDDETRQAEEFFTYKFLSSAPQETGTHDTSTASGYTVTRSAHQEWLRTVQVDLYNSEDGMSQLEEFCIAAKRDPQIKVLFGKQCEFVEALGVTNNTIVDDAKKDYHHTLICTFNIRPEYELTEANAVVDAVSFSMTLVGAEENKFIVFGEPGDFPLSSDVGGTWTFVEA